MNKEQELIWHTIKDIPSLVLSGSVAYGTSREDSDLDMFISTTADVDKLLKGGFSLRGTTVANASGMFENREAKINILVLAPLHYEIQALALKITLEHVKPSAFVFRQVKKALYAVSDTDFT